MISANNLSIQFGAKPLFENVSATFGNGNRFGLIGATGAAHSESQLRVARTGVSDKQLSAYEFEVALPD
jgi:ATPase subunit of ABC transporter with duplicated ATPase domains